MEDPNCTKEHFQANGAVDAGKRQMDISVPVRNVDCVGVVSIMGRRKYLRVNVNNRVDKSE
jgi:hypothetical protein